MRKDSWSCEFISQISSSFPNFQTLDGRLYWQLLWQQKHPYNFPKWDPLRNHFWSSQTDLNLKETAMIFFSFSLQQFQLPSSSKMASVQKPHPEEEKYHMFWWFLVMKKLLSQKHQVILLRSYQTKLQPYNSSANQNYSNQTDPLLELEVGSAVFAVGQWMENVWLSIKTRDEGRNDSG